MSFTTKKGRASAAPRQGQWVLLDGSKLGIAVGPDVLDPRTGVSVYRVVGEIVLQLPHPETTRGFPTDDSRTQVDLVDPKTGFSTVAHLLVATDRLEPVTDRNAIPGPRLATMDPAWSPRA